MPCMVTVTRQYNYSCNIHVYPSIAAAVDNLTRRVGQAKEGRGLGCAINAVHHSVKSPTAIDQSYSTTTLNCRQSGLRLERRSLDSDGLE
jgi:hypothetical protein